MLYTIERINRTVELDDALVEKYSEYDELREQQFCIVIKSKYGHAPTTEEVSDFELSKLCNDILLSDLNALEMLPQALGLIDKLTVASKDGNLVEYEIDHDMGEYEVIIPDNMSIDGLKKWYYAAVRDILCAKGLNRKEVLLLLTEYRLIDRLEQFTEAELHINPENVANIIYDIRDNIICKKCHKGKIVVFEDRGGYSVRCNYCKRENNCRCETKERAISFWNKGIYKL